MMIRPYQPADSEAVVRLALRAWEPVFESIRDSLDPAVYETFYPNGWRSHQQSDVEAALADQAVWVAERDGAVAGFVSIVLHPDDNLGEVHMIAVDPDHQQAGIGAALTDHAVVLMRDSGVKIAMIETGADPGHGPARRLYERSGFGLWPVSRYFNPDPASERFCCLVGT
jgi:ribosomal protein S18 acetylase RimI-like enzyme